ncbi:MAG: hypothetical protein Q7S52_05915 [bacterium]|nr:hypothetical protein [bacterium]
MNLISKLKLAFERLLPQYSVEVRLFIGIVLVMLLGVIFLVFLNFYFIFYWAFIFLVVPYVLTIGASYLFKYLFKETFLGRTMPQRPVVRKIFIATIVLFALGFLGGTFVGRNWEFLAGLAAGLSFLNALLMFARGISNLFHDTERGSSFSAFIWSAVFGLEAIALLAFVFRDFTI